jgi:hypothetical protein
MSSFTTPSLANIYPFPENTGDRQLTFTERRLAAMAISGAQQEITDESTLQISHEDSYQVGDDFHPTPELAAKAALAAVYAIHDSMQDQGPGRDASQTANPQADASAAAADFLAGNSRAA